MSLLLDIMFLSSDGMRVVAVAQATGAAGKQSVFKLSATPEVPSDGKAVLRLGSSLHVNLPRIVDEANEGADKAWAKCGSLEEGLVVQMLFKKTSLFWKLSKAVVTCDEATLPHQFVPAARVTCDDEEAAKEMLAAAREGDSEDLARYMSGEMGAIPVDYQNEGGNTALHYASANGHEDCTQLLVGKGARNLPNVSGNTPLHWAVLNKHEGVVKMLLSTPGADVLAKNAFGRSALTDAFAAEQQDVTLLLLQHPSASALDRGEGVAEEEVDEQVEEGDDDGRADDPMQE